VAVVRDGLDDGCAEGVGQWCGDGGGDLVADDGEVVVGGPLFAVAEGVAVVSAIAADAAVVDVAEYVVPGDVLA
jgi:hypothetical protein